jgi:hypothetical protein
MALFERPSMGSLITGFALGLGAAYLMPDLMPAVGRAGRPALLALMRTGLQLYERGRETLAELQETAGDMVAEAQSALELERASAAGAAPGPRPGNGHSPDA